MTERICNIWAGIWQSSPLVGCRLCCIQVDGGGMVHPMEGIVRYTSEERHYHAYNTSLCSLSSVFGGKDEEFPPSMERVVETTERGLKQPKRVLIYISDRNRAS
jgi:hypothetical protein